jgi:hypothetical protein
MVREEQDREDLMREATALVQRIELRLNRVSEPVVVGFRANNAASIFFGGDPVYQFNVAAELRRAFVEGVIYKAEKGKLVALRRERSEQQVSLVRHDLSDPEIARFRDECRERIRSLRSIIRQGDFEIVAQVPSDGLTANRIIGWLSDLEETIRFAHSPRVA